MRRLVEVVGMIRLPGGSVGCDLVSVGSVHVARRASGLLFMPLDIMFLFFVLLPNRSFLLFAL